MKAVTFSQGTITGLGSAGISTFETREKHFNLINQRVIIKSSTFSHCFLPLALPPSVGAGGGEG